MGHQRRPAEHFAVSPGDSVSLLEDRAERWVSDVHPHAPHLVRARDWVVVLDPSASDELRVAAMLHDIERAFPDTTAPWDPAADWSNPAYLRWHQDRSAAIAGSWLADEGADPVLTAAVESLITVHEDGGWPEADLLQAADSLSFLETLKAVPVAWVRRGISPAVARAKVRFMADRIVVEAAKQEAERLVNEALDEIASAVSELA